MCVQELASETIEPTITSFHRCQYVVTRSKRRSSNTQLSVNTEHRGYYECIDDDRVQRIRPSISLSEAMLSGLYKGVRNGFIDPLTNKAMSLHDAFECGMIDRQRSHIIANNTRVTVENALRRGLLNAERSCCVIDGVNTPLDGMIGEELSLVEAISEGLIKDGEIVDVQTGLRFTLQYAIHNCLLSRADHSGFTILSSGQTFSLSNALDNGIIDADGKYVHKPTGLKCYIVEAVNQG